MRISLSPRKWNRIFVLGLYFTVIFSHMSLNVYYSNLDDYSFVEERFPNFETYYEPLKISIQSLLVLIAILTVFYLGKFREYRLEFLKFQGEIIETVIKFQKKYDKYRWGVDIELYKFSEKAVDHFSKEMKHLRRKPKFTISISLIAILVFANLLFESTAASDNPTGEEFLKIILLLYVSVGALLTLWGFNEIIATDHEDSLGYIVQMNSIMKSKLD